MSSVQNQTTVQPFLDAGEASPASRGLDGSSYVSSIESMENRAECSGDDTCTDGWFCNCLYTVGVAIGTALLFPFTLVFYAIHWIYDTIVDTYEFYFSPPAPLEMNLDPEAVEIGSHYQMNTTRRAEIPDPIDWNAIFSSNDTGSVRVEELLECFDAVFGTDPTQTHFSDLAAYRRDSLRISIRDYVNFITNRDLTYSEGVTTEAYYDQLTLFMKNVIVLMKDQSISNDRKRLAFTELAEASRRCVPRRLEESLKQYRYLTNNEDNIDNKVREWLQMFKEDILTRYFQGTNHFHALNHARTVVRGWGLVQPDARAEFDPYNFSFGYSRGQYYRRLEQNYLPAQVISSIQTKMDFFGEVELATKYLQKKYEEELIDDEELGKMFVSIEENGVAVGSSITLYGTAKLLEFLGFIEPV